MHCPNCKSEMEIGYLAGALNKWSPGSALKERFTGNAGGSGMHVDAYRCPKCGKVELTTETGK